jgi:hypothetical protein
MNTYITILYDIYNSLLTDKQKEYFEDYYFNNLTLSEIGENNGISRNAIHKQIKNVEEKLNEFESKLNLYKKSELLDKVISKTNDLKLKKELEKINNI